MGRMFGCQPNEASPSLAIPAFVFETRFQEMSRVEGLDKRCAAQGAERL